MSVLARSSRRWLLRHPWQVGLSTLGVGLGVAVVVAIDLANDSALRAFSLSTEAVAGRATHRISAGTAGLPEALYVDLRVRDGVRPSAPVVEGDVAAPGYPGRTFHLLGVDPFAEPPFRGYLRQVTLESGGDLTPFLVRSGQVLLSGDTARQMGLGLGGRLLLRVGDRRREVTIAGLLHPADRRVREGISSLLLADVSTAQELLGRVGRLTGIDLVLNSPAEFERVRRLLPPGASLEPARARGEAMAQMTRAFQLNLTALSRMALLVGLFLIYNTMTFSVVQRRTLIGTLRALGVTRREIFGQVLAEAAAMAVVGTALGLALGVALAGLLLRLVTRTINDLYFAVSVRELHVTAGGLAVGAALGLVATLVAALLPAYEATTAPPRVAMTRASLEQRARRSVPRGLAAAAGLLAVGAICLLVPSRSIELAFAGLFCLLLGCAALSPAVTVASMAVFGPPAARLFGPLGRLATRGVTAALSRTAVAIAALAMAVSVTVGVGVMIASFRETVVRWLAQSLQADVFVTAPRLVATRGDATLEPALVARLTATPGVAAAAIVRDADVPSPQGPVNLVALSIGPRSEVSYEFKEGDPRQAWRRFEREPVVLISEPFAWRRGLGVGSTLRLPTPAGEVALPVVGVYHEYGSATGSVLLNRVFYERWWRDPAVSGLGLYLSPGARAETVIAELRRRAGSALIAVQSSRTLREESLRVFDRTFLITSVLRLLATVVAFIGVLSALMAIQLERARELAVLRATGLTPLQVWGLVTLQTVLMGLAAGLLALPVGSLLAVVLIEVVNRRSFGWTMPVMLPPAVLAQAVGLAVLAAVTAGLLPAARMARTTPALALREE